MKLKISIISTVLFLLFSSGAIYGQETSLTMPDSEKMFGVPDEIRKEVNTFFAGLLDGEIEKPYKTLLSDSPLTGKKEDVEELLRQTRKVNKYYGKMKGFEFVSSEAVTPSYMRIRYLGLCEKYPMRWIFTYYKSPKKGWVVTNILFDDMTEYYFSD